jgi:hypothetical protein
VEEETAERDSREKLTERNWRSCHPATDLFVIDRDRPRERGREREERERFPEEWLYVQKKILKFPSLMPELLCL